MTAVGLSGTVLATVGVWSSTPSTPPTASAEEESEKFVAGIKKVQYVFHRLIIVFI